MIGALLRTARHFFGPIPDLFRCVEDPREQSKCVYPLGAILFAGVLLFVFRLGARRQISFWLRQDPGSAGKFKALFDVEGCPHGDTLNATYSQLDPAELQQVVNGQADRLIRGKVLDGFRIQGRFVIGVDGTGIVTYRERHCPHCLTQTQNGVTIFYHNVLEAKLLCANGFALSIMSEFVENTGEHVTKQDCELRAFYRLAEHLKARFPRLPILLSLDGLFANGPTFQICDDYDWKYVIVLKDDRLKSVNQEFRSLLDLEHANRLVHSHGKDNAIRQAFRWVNKIRYVDDEKRAHTVSVLECRETKPGGTGSQEAATFRWVTNCSITPNNVLALANGGRIRWKIENEGFNVQKNGGYGLEHAYTKNPVAAKVFYLLLQIAHTLTQLFEKGSLLKRLFPDGFGSSRNLALRLLEAWRNARASGPFAEALRPMRMQIRFDTT